jgi:hypothetical protein
LASPGAGAAGCGGAAAEIGAIGPVWLGELVMSSHTMSGLWWSQLQS